MESPTLREIIRLAERQYRYEAQRTFDPDRPLADLERMLDMILDETAESAVPMMHQSLIGLLTEDMSLGCLTPQNVDEDATAFEVLGRVIYDLVAEALMPVRDGLLDEIRAAETVIEGLELAQDLSQVTEAEIATPAKRAKTVARIVADYLDSEDDKMCAAILMAHIEKELARA